MVLHACVKKLVNPTLIPWPAKLEALTYEMTQARADLHEIKEQVKEISCRESSTVGEHHSHRERTIVITLITHPISMVKYMKNIKLDVPTFDGRHDPQLFLE